MKSCNACPNFSEGGARVRARVESRSSRSSPSKLLDRAHNKDHTSGTRPFSGARRVDAAAMASPGRAAGTHRPCDTKGSHPRHGPWTWYRSFRARMTMAEAVEIARRFGRAFAEKHQITVFFYEEACTTEARRSLAEPSGAASTKGCHESSKIPHGSWTRPQKRTRKSGVDGGRARMPLIGLET